MKTKETLSWAILIIVALLLCWAFAATHPIVRSETGQLVQVCYQLTLGVPQPYHPVPCGAPWIGK